MTTSSTNNSVFKGFFDKQKLTRPNFIDWYRQLRILLSIKDKLNYLEQPIPPAPVAPAGQHVTSEILAAQIVGLMLMNMDPEFQRNLESLHAQEMLRELKTLFAQQAEHELLQTTRDFHSCMLEEGQSVSTYVLKMKSYIDNLDRLGLPVTLGLGVSLILIGLRKEYDSFVQNYNMHSLGKTVNELHAMLKLHEQTLPKKNAPALNAIRAGKVQKSNKHKKSQSQKAARGHNHGKGKNKQAYAPKPKIPPPPKRENPAKDSIRHECGEIRHRKRNCPQYLAELLKKKKNAASGAGGSGIFGLRASRKLKPGALSLYVGNGQREAVEAIGAFYLCLPSGLEIILNKFHYAPSITRGIISVSRFAIPRDGIFEIDLSNSLTNESSIYAVSNKRAKLELDSALLWHCRLGHISKKLIEKLKYDGLIDSSDLRAFEKCVSCMSGKEARKPYTHQLERAKDLLGLIHTDICYPFKIMSRQGANYFVTLTDDFSRYGYVYLLKHKHKVFETFKVFQKEVENQLGEYMSQEFLDHLKDHGIIAHRTPPYTLQHNGVSERRNRTLLDMVRSLMSQTTLLKSFWDYALETAARILNMVPTKNVEKTPYGETMRYSFKYPPENKVLVARNAEFLENSLVNQEASRSIEDLEIIQEEDTHPSIDTSLNHEKNDLEIDEPQSDIVPIRRSTRTRHAPDRMYLYIDAEEHELGDLGEPANYKAALFDPESEKWLNAMNVEM
nr:retrotransposon protein, putative, Ty1-copia subclass [Tanacetum cinerariifolium]